MQNLCENTDGVYNMGNGDATENNMDRTIKSGRQGLFKALPIMFRPLIIVSSDHCVPKVS